MCPTGQVSRSGVRGRSCYALRAQDGAAGPGNDAARPAGAGPSGAGLVRLAEAERQGQALVRERARRTLSSGTPVAKSVGQDLVRDQRRVLRQGRGDLRVRGGPAQRDAVRDVQAAVLAGLLDQADGVAGQARQPQLRGDLQVQGDRGARSRRPPTSPRAGSR